MDVPPELNLQEQENMEGKTNRNEKEELMMHLMKRNQNSFVVLGGEGNFYAIAVLTEHYRIDV